MIKKDDLKPGNWISLKLAGSLLESHKIIETGMVPAKNILTMEDVAIMNKCLCKVDVEINPRQCL